MIPSTSGFLNAEFRIIEQPSRTYKMNLNEESTVKGYTENLEAMKQAIYKILNTERYEYIMYSWNYGVELKDLFGEPTSFVCPELERRITEALTWDKRITGVTDFEFDTSKKSVVSVSFKVSTIYGDIDAEKEVNF